MSSVSAAVSVTLAIVVDDAATSAIAGGCAAGASGTVDGPVSLLQAIQLPKQIATIAPIQRNPICFRILLPLLVVSLHATESVPPTVTTYLPSTEVGTQESLPALGITRAHSCLAEEATLNHHRRTRSFPGRRPSNRDRSRREQPELCRSERESFRQRLGRSTMYRLGGQATLCFVVSLLCCRLSSTTATVTFPVLWKCRDRAGRTTRFAVKRTWNRGPLRLAGAA